MKTQQGKQMNKTREISIEHCDRLTCPICETNRIELEDATVILSRYRGMSGNTIFLPGHCEHGHRFSICYSNHLGHVRIWAMDHEHRAREMQGQLFK
jgi:hypothetical protein